MRQLTSVLEEAHRLKLIHRDIKPSNLLLNRFTKEGPIYLKVLDFGIAKEVGPGHGKLTATGSIVGTPMYMSPEQAEGEVRQIDGRSDQYSAGIVLYELLAGRPPFQDENAAGLMFSQMNRQPPPLPDTVPASLREVVMRMLSKKPGDRYANPKALDSALAGCEKDCRDAPSAPRARGWLSADFLTSTLSAIGLRKTSTSATLSSRAAYDATMSADGTKPTPQVVTISVPKKRLMIAGGLLLLAVFGALIYVVMRPADPAAAAVEKPSVAKPASSKSATGTSTSSGGTAQKKSRSSH
jgi:serine/threonine protein kinase